MLPISARQLVNAFSRFQMVEWCAARKIRRRHSRIPLACKAFETETRKRIRDYVNEHRGQ